MKEDIKEKWIAALRSGQFTQGRKTLRDTANAYCCLGVLCDLYQKETGNGQWKDVEHELLEENRIVQGFAASVTNPHPHFFTTIPPMVVLAWAGLSPGYDNLGSLAYQNDSGKPFEEIADFIEKEL